MKEIIGFRIPVIKQIDGTIYFWTNDEETQEALR